MRLLPDLSSWIQVPLERSLFPLGYILRLPWIAPALFRITSSGMEEPPPNEAFDFPGRVGTLLSPPGCFPPLGEWIYESFVPSLRAFFQDSFPPLVSRNGSFPLPFLRSFLFPGSLLRGFIDLLCFSLARVSPLFPPQPRLLSLVRPARDSTLQTGSEFP